MNLSMLRLNPRSTRVRIEVARPYQMHRTILRAFPDAAQGGPGRVMFRVDSDRAGELRLLVQSETTPDWGFLDESLDYTLPGGVSTREFRPQPVSGEERVFRLRANPTVKRCGRRWGLYSYEEQVRWMQRKASSGGFEVQSLTVKPEGVFHDLKPETTRRTTRMSFLSVRYDGVIRVVDPVAFLATLEAGVGSAKGFGFGLLSIAPKPGE